MPGHCSVAPAAVSCAATAAPHCESHGDTGWVAPAPVAELSISTDVLDVICSAPTAWTQAPRALALEARRLLRLVTVALMSEVEGSCRGRAT